MPNAALINEIEQLFARHGEQVHHQQGAESVTVLAHALHTAQLAEWADADEPLVAAALLHVLGRMLGEAGEANDARAAEWLSDGFGDELVAPLRLQREARRYLRAIEPGAAVAAGAGDTPMSLAEQLEFDVLPHARRAVQLCRLIQQARNTPVPRTPPLDYYLALLEDLQRQYGDRDKLEVGPQTVS